jgi:hypothetical protein
MSTFSFDPQLGYLPAIPLPFYGRMKWWHLRTNFVCGECRKGFRVESEYQTHYALTHIPALPVTQEEPQ